MFLDGPAEVRMEDGVVVYAVSLATVLSLEVTDDSAVAQTWISLDGAPATLYEGPFQLDGPTRRLVLAVWSVDAAGNAEAPWSEHLLMDATGPSVEIVSPRPGAGGGEEDVLRTNSTTWTLDWPARAELGVPLDFHAEGRRMVWLQTVVEAAAVDAEGSGVTRFDFLLDGALQQSGPRDRWTWYPLPWHVGDHVVTVRAYDRFGNVEEASVVVTHGYDPRTSPTPTPVLP